MGKLNATAVQPPPRVEPPAHAERHGVLGAAPHRNVAAQLDPFERQQNFETRVSRHHFQGLKRGGFKVRVCVTTEFNLYRPHGEDVLIGWSTCERADAPWHAVQRLLVAVQVGFEK